ncbi:MAG: N-acetylmuramoyl-L-alanine amidase [Desulfovibrionaceae bacterium]
MTGWPRRLGAAGLAVLLCLVFCGWPSPAPAASAQAAFTGAWKEFHALKDDPGRAKFRSYWLKLENRFLAAYEMDKDGDYAPKSLYYAGRVYEELGDRSFLSSDYKKAVERYSQAAARFPNHRWIDDCIYFRGMIRLNKLHDQDEAYADFLTVVHDYPDGDMASKARQAIREMDRNIPSPRVAAAKTSVRRKSGDDARLMAVRYNTNDEYTRVVLDVDEDVRYRYNLLEPVPEMGRPHRVYVDLEGAVVDGGVHHEIKVADGNLRRIRSAQYDRDTARVVLDFHNLQEYKIFPLNNPFRIVVDVFAPPEGSKPDPVKTPPKAAAAKYTPPAGSKKMVDSLVEQLGLTIKTIMIDPGHGGKDPGAHSNGILEKDINLRFAKILGGLLRDKGFKVLYTRTSDVFVPLEERTAKANMNKVDMFISVHCNAHKSRSINGLETYSLNLARSRDAVRVAARENAVSPKRISDLQMILTDLMLSSKMKESSDLASRIHLKAVDSVSRRWKVRDHGTREAPFYVLMGAKMPSVLLELGYLTNSDEASRLKSDAYLKTLAQGVVGGVVAYKKQIERFAER